MRHRNKTKKLGRTKAHRKMTLQNLATAMVDPSGSPKGRLGPNRPVPSLR